MASVATAKTGAQPYSIDDAMALMRRVPLDGGLSTATIINVVRTTLESANVDVDKVIEGGAEKLERVEGRVTQLESDVEQLESQVQRCRERIAELEADIAETKMVKERLLAAQRSQEADAAARAPIADPRGEADADEDIPPTRVTSPVGLISDDD